MITEKAIRDSYPLEYVTSRQIAHTESSHKLGSYHNYIKRALDIMISLFGLIVAVPLVAIFAIAIIAETSGSPFYLQERVGLMGKNFRIIKLRSMVMNAEKDGLQWAVKNDARVTKVGAFIRKSRIDELPQLLNILRGDMSIVGPRPERSHFTKQFNNEIPGFIDRLVVKPGLTGWAQINGGYDITPGEKLELDLHYIHHLSWRMDLRIMLRTVKVVLTGDGAR